MTTIPIGPGHTFHWLHWRTSCSLVGKYCGKTVGKYAICFFFDNVLWRELLVPLQLGRLTKIGFGYYFWLMGPIGSNMRANYAQYGQMRPNTANYAKYSIWRAYFGKPKIVECGTREKIMQNVAHTCWPWVNRTPQSNQQIKFWCDVPIVVTM